MWFDPLFAYEVFSFSHSANRVRDISSSVFDSIVKDSSMKSECSGQSAAFDVD